MDLSQFTKENKNLLKSEPTKQNIDHSKSNAGRPPLENQEEKLTYKVSINLNENERHFLETLNKKTGIPISSYLRRQLLAADSFQEKSI